MLASTVFPGLRGMDCANFAAVFSPTVNPGISKIGVKKQETLFPDFLFRIFANSGGYPVVISQYNYVGCLCLSGSFSVKTELEQGSNKPLLYAVLGICIDISILKGGKPDSPAVMPQDFLHGFRLSAGRPDNGFIRYEFRIPHAKAPPFPPATSARRCGYNAMPYFYNARINPRFPAVCNSRKSKGK